MSVFNTGSGAGIYTKRTTDVLGLGATVDANGSFVSADGPIIRFGATNPSGVVTANAGSLSLSSGAAYISRGGTFWNTLTSVPSTGKGGYQFYALTTQTSGIGSGTSGVLIEIPFTSTTYLANTFTTGSTIRIRLAGIFSVDGAAPATTMLVRFDLGPNFVGSVVTGAIAGGLNSPVILDVQFTFLSAGVTGSVTSSFQGSYTAIALGSVNNTAVVNTTVGNSLLSFVQFNNASPGTSFRINQYNVDLYQ